MTVKELIEQLELCDPNMEVMYRDIGSIDYPPYNIPIDAVQVGKEYDDDILWQPKVNKDVVILR